MLQSDWMQGAGLGFWPGVVAMELNSEASRRTSAIIETKDVEDTTVFCSRHNVVSTLDHRFHPHDDKSALDSEVILYQAEGIFYRLPFRVKADNHLAECGS